MVCKCISYNYWQKGYIIKDDSSNFWNEKAQISSSNMETLENFIGNYSLKIKDNPEYLLMIEKIIKTDPILKTVDYQLPRLE
jgi:hypothetical protein